MRTVKLKPYVDFRDPNGKAITQPTAEQIAAAQAAKRSQQRTRITQAGSQWQGECIRAPGDCYADNCCLRDEAKA